MVFRCRPGNDVGTLERASNPTNSAAVTGLDENHTFGARRYGRPVRHWSVVKSRGYPLPQNLGFYFSPLLPRKHIVSRKKPNWRQRGGLCFSIYDFLKATPLPYPRQYQCGCRYKPRGRSLWRGAPCLTRTDLLMAVFNKHGSWTFGVAVEAFLAAGAQPVLLRAPDKTPMTDRPNGPGDSSPGMRPKADSLGEKTPSVPAA